VSAIDGRVTNAGVARYQQLEGRHLDPVSPRTFGPEVIALKVQTRQSDLYVSEAARTRLFVGDRLLTAQRGLYQMEDYVQQILEVDLRLGVPLRVEKMVTFYTSRDRAVSDTLARAGTAASRSPGFGQALERHASAWEELWQVCEIRVPGDERVQLLLRLHTCHVLQVCSRHTADRDAGVPARGLNGEAYRGHVEGRLTVEADRQAVSGPIKVGTRDEVRELASGDRHVFELRRRTDLEPRGNH
jgi:trehalose/maltose hydrolase-like predicted phosphorylase